MKNELLQDIVTIVLFLSLFFIMSVTEEEGVTVTVPSNMTTVTANECQ